MTNETLTESEFKNVLENKLSVLLTHGDWTAKLDCGVKVLKYNTDLLVFIHANRVEVLASGYIVELTNPKLVQKISEAYFIIKEQQDVIVQANMQTKVLETVNKLTSFLEPM